MGTQRKQIIIGILIRESQGSWVLWWQMTEENGHCRTRKQKTMGTLMRDSSMIMEAMRIVEYSGKGSRKLSWFDNSRDNNLISNWTTYRGRVCSIPKGMRAMETSSQPYPVHALVVSFLLQSQCTKCTHIRVSLRKMMVYAWPHTTISDRMSEM